ncbi:MAG: helicase-associated domain-containing protein [Treponema sp.]|jgi:hypothetical protein|nr:helicase-associated domain-containing protein [Treponema sp.]
MNVSVFRPVEFWKSALMTLPDSAFFDLLRNVFGAIKTPFNKQLLLDNLVSFLQQKDIQDAAVSYINHNDRRIIAAVAVLNEPSSGKLEHFFAGEINYAGLHDNLVNLEERFILYRFRDNGKSRIALNPLFERILEPLALDTFLLFPSFSPNEAAANGVAPNGEDIRITPLDGRILAALLSFVEESGVFFRTGGKIRKNIIDRAKAVFPRMDFETVTGSLRALGLFNTEGNHLVPDYRRFAAFGNLSLRERLEYFAAGVICFDKTEPEADISFWPYRTTVRKYAAFIHQFIGILEPERLYPVSTLGRIAGILENNNQRGSESGKTDNIDSGSLIQAMEKTGLLAGTGGKYRRLGLSAADSGKDGTKKTGQAETQEAAPLIAIAEPSSILLYPEIAYNDAVSLAAFSAVKETSLAVRFELNRDSALRAFRRGITADSIIDLLKRLSHNRISETLVWTITDWEKRYSEVTLRRGLVLGLSPERRYLAETKPLARLIQETLAPGIYLLAETAEEEALQTLRKAGVDMVAQNARTENPADAEGPGLSGGFFPALNSVSRSGIPLRASQPASGGAEENSGNDVLPPQASTLIAGFHAILKEMPLNKEEHSELAARIDRRLVLSESQLKDAVIRYEKLEAGGLDYVGKALIAKQAIALQSPVELVRPGKNGERIFGIPKALEKEGGENMLVISPLPESGNPGGDTIRIPLGKIGLLRRIKKSIFENSSG